MMNTDFHRRWWFRSGLNRKPSTYEVDALTDWATEPYGPSVEIRTPGLFGPNEALCQTELHPDVGAGDGNRTRVSCLEGRCSTIELHRRRSQPEFHWSHYCGRRFTGCRYNLKGGSIRTSRRAWAILPCKARPVRIVLLRCAFTHINTTGFLFAYQSILLSAE